MNEEIAMLQELFPVAPVPLECELEPSPEGTRYHVASDGLWREVQTAWLSVLAPIAQGASGLTPFGNLVERAQIKVQPPKRMWGEFLAQAQAAFPYECAAVMAWNQLTGSWRLAARLPLRANGAYIEYLEPQLGPDEVPVVDIHSHGRHPAFFSSLDNKDDEGGIKVSVVLGNIDGAVTMAGRLVVLNHMYALSMDGEGNWSVGDRT